MDEKKYRVDKQDYAEGVYKDGPVQNVLPSGEIAVVCERDGYTVCEVIVVAPEQIFGQCTR